MAYTRLVKNKAGRVTSGEIYVTNGSDIHGKPIRERIPWKPEPNMTERQMQKAIESYALECENTIKRGGKIDTKTTFAEYAEDFMERKEKNIEHRTVLNYRHLLKRINKGIGHIKLRELRPLHIAKFMDNLRESGVRESESRAVATRLVPVLKERMLARAKLAELAGISEATVSVAAHGKRIALQSAEQMAAALGVPVEQLFVVTKNTEPLSEKMVLEYHAFIHLVLEDAFKNCIVDYNAANRVDRPKPKQKEVESLQPDEVETVLDAVDNADIPLKWRIIVHLLLATGCRRGEIMGLRWGKINFDTGELKIDKALLYSQEKGLYEGNTKTKQTRTVDLPDETLELLKEYRVWFEAEKASYGEHWQRACNEKQIEKERKWHGTDYVFVQAGGWPMHPDSINSWMKKFTKEHDLPHINPHKFRHTQASYLIYSGNNVASVARRLGHAQVSTTMNVYTHAIDEARAQMKESVGAMMYGNRRKKSG